MAHIFLSYSREDTEFMQRIRGDLRAAGFEVWTDDTGLEPGTPAWETAVQRAIEAANCMVVLLSPAAKESLWVTRELSYAENQNLRIFPVLLRGDQKSSVPIRLSSTQHIDARRDYPVALVQLTETIRRFTEGTSDVHPAASTQPPVQRPGTVAAPAQKPASRPQAKPEASQPQTTGRPAWVVPVIIVVALLAVGITAAIVMSNSGGDGEPREVPGILGLSEDEAYAILDTNDLEGNVGFFDDACPPEELRVGDQNPGPGEIVDPGTTVDFALVCP